MDYIYDPGANGSQSNQLQKMTYGSDSISYTYDNNGNITSIQTEDGTVTYEYDELYRLIREDNQILDQTIAYIYTFDGDLCGKKIYDYMPDTDLWMPQEIQPEETILYEYTADGLNLLTEYDGQTITYDAIGNPLQYRGMNLTWSNGRELYSVSKNGTTTTYRYNKDGMRNRKYLGDGTVIYQIQGSLISGEQKIGQDEQSLVYELEYYYDSNGNILSMLYNGTEYYYLKNIQGDIIGILDGSGASVVEYSYDSWGKVIEISGNQELGKRNPFRYRGYYYDEETGFYYVGSRYYDPEVCRFINADTEEAFSADYQNFSQYNLYAYCWNNPVNMSDDNGDWPGWATKVVIGAAAIAIGAAAVALTGGGATAILPAIVSSLKVAATSAAISAGTNAISNRVSTGSWKGSGKALLNGAADGFMWGGITAGATTVALASKGVYVNKIGKLKPAGKSGNGYAGVRYGVKKNSSKLSYRSIELHSPHKGKHNFWHWQKNQWSYYEKIWSVSDKKARVYTLLGRRVP